MCAVPTAALFLLLAVTSCDRPADTEGAASAPVRAFSHDMSTDLSGYYTPAGDVRVGKWSFDHIFVGQAQDFRGWEAGSRSETFGPVMIQFDDTSSPMVADKYGSAVEHIVTARVLPTRYSVTDTRIRFEGRSAELGAVLFEGVLDPGALATARRNLGDEGVVVTGTLKVGRAPSRTVQLRWWGGD